MASVRLLIAAGMLAWPTWRALRDGSLDRRLFGLSAICGVLYALHFGAWVWSLELTTVAASVTLVTATPIFLAAWGMVTGRDVPPRRQLIGIGITLVGVAILSGLDLGGSWRAFAGDLLALLGAAAIGVYMVLARKHADRIPVWGFLGAACMVGGLTLALVCVVSGVSLQLATPSAWLWLALSAGVSQLIGHGALTWALRHATPTTVAIATVGEPVGAVALAWLILQEVPTGASLLGCAIVLAGVVLSILPGGEPAATSSERPGTGPGNT